MTEGDRCINSLLINQERLISEVEKGAAVLIDDSVAKELYQRLSAKVQNVAQKITKQVEATTQAWHQPAASDRNDLSSTFKTK